MGMSAEIIAIGPYDPDLRAHYEYDPPFYGETKVGARIVTRLFLLSEGSGASREFARLLGVDDPWDFNQHALDPARIDLKALRTFLETLPGWIDDGYADSMSALEAFVRHGYDLQFMPNG